MTPTLWAVFGVGAALVVASILLLGGLRYELREVGAREVGARLERIEQGLAAIAEKLDRGEP